MLKSSFAVGTGLNAGLEKMVSAVSHIKNPLTIIGIFAGIVEISANLVLPFLEPAQQGIYLWFLMLFPAGLVFFFFITLNFNHTKLYAPSDFNDDNTFMQASGKMLGNKLGSDSSGGGIKWP